MSVGVLAVEVEMEATAMADSAWGVGMLMLNKKLEL